MLSSVIPPLIFASPLLQSIRYNSNGRWRAALLVTPETTCSRTRPSARDLNARTPCGRQLSPGLPVRYRPREPGRYGRPRNVLGGEVSAGDPEDKCLY